MQRLREAILPSPWHPVWTRIAEAADELRQARAKQLFDTWMGASLAADSWMLAAMSEALEGVKSEAQAAIS